MTGDAPESRLRSRTDERGRFTHPWPLHDGAGRGLRELMRWQWQRMRDGVAPAPPAAAFARATPDPVRPHAAAHELRITWVGHSTFLIQVPGANILTDPVWSRRASPVSWLGPARLAPPGIAFDDLPPIDVVLISHDHYDHLDARTVARLHDRFGTALHWVTPIGYRGWLERRGIAGSHELDWWQRTAFTMRGSTIALHATPAQHWTKRSPFSERLRLWSSFVIDTGGARIFFCGDSGYFDGFRDIGARFAPFDAVLLPIGAYEPRWFMKPAHMNPAEAVQAYVDLGAAGSFVAMHWGTFLMTDEPALEPPLRTRQAWAERALPRASLWIPQHGETRRLTAR
ncbi:MAG TPA: MBL fold metallo-hydrolase [Longimicrobiales bacterium]|nr:MBL fold metallo-hydrolase [Longimicrobiales bacterium]